MDDFYGLSDPTGGWIVMPDGATVYQGKERALIALASAMAPPSEAFLKRMRDDDRLDTAINKAADSAGISAPKQTIRATSAADLQKVTGGAPIRAPRAKGGRVLKRGAFVVPDEAKRVFSFR